ncbi:MAG: DUF218 domain-containing protein [Rhodococcus sp.]|nr:DUF218 domain-containing protein [Rhodococcus sp. (in: high G+C Gram-positive bacteria)]
MPQSALESCRTRPSIARRLLVWGAAAVSAVTLVVVASTAWISLEASGHVYRTATAPSAPVVIVLGSKVQGGEPQSFLAGRLDAAAKLVSEGRAEAVLASGNGASPTGNEVEVMSDYLVGKGVDGRRIVGDPFGLDTYDTCARAVQTFGVTKALIVTQGLHVSRAVALCRHAGMDVDGVDADCECSTLAFAQNQVREVLARPKAIYDLVSNRAPAVVSRPENSVTVMIDR